MSGVHYEIGFEAATQTEALDKGKAAIAEILAAHPGMKPEWRVPFGAYICMTATGEGWRCYGRFTLERATARNLLIVPRVEAGIGLLRAFGVDPADWRVVSFGAVLLGLRFDRVVVILPPAGRVGAMEWVHEFVRCRVLPEGALDII